ncbi:MAG TPA: hypothetical protein VFX97_17375 [Pyrinomonadaceae bacterium]|nr:hypothetical protein [Pyrinomonadaceae bacterium]
MPKLRDEQLIQRRRAIDRGLAFIYESACDAENFADYGFDYLGCFHCVASTSKDPKLRRTATEMGRERARHWRRQNSKLTPDADANEVLQLVYGSYAADSLGVRNKRFKEQLRQAAAKFTARDYFGFDPATEPPPGDVPEECACETMNERGRKRCVKCRKRLTMTTRYAVWQDALIGSYMGEQHGVRLGTSYADVIKWLNIMRPYPKLVGEDPWNVYDATYAVTHVVYTLNSYSCYKLSPRWLAAEYAFLKQNLTQAIAWEDPETMGEFLDTLKSFGLGDSNRLIVKGMKYLLATQNADGSWGDMEADDVYNRYHPTWTAIDGLREYSWRGTRLSFPKVAPLLRTTPHHSPL